MPSDDYSDDSGNPIDDRDPLSHGGKHLHMSKMDIPPLKLPHRSDDKSAEETARELVGQLFDKIKARAEKAESQDEEPLYPVEAACLAWKAAIASGDVVAAELAASDIKALIKAYYPNRPAYTLPFGKLEQNMKQGGALNPANVALLDKLIAAAQGQAGLR